MRQVLTGWIIVAGCLVFLGMGTVIGAEMTRGTTVPAATLQEWRQYASDVERGARTPTKMATRMLTETAIAQHEYASAAEQLLKLVGGGVALLALFLVVDLARHRARLGREPAAGAE